MALKKKKNNEFYTEETYISIDGELGILTSAQKKERAYQLLNYTRGAARGRDSMITANVIGVESNGSFVAAICEYEGFKIVIADKDFMDFPEFDPKDHPYESEAKMHEIMLRGCIGAEIDFCALPKKKVGGKVLDTIDREKMFALCSRKLAMDKRYANMWCKQRDGSRRITEGRTVEARVVRVSNTSAWMETGGVEFMVAHKELSWSRVGNARELVQPGKRVFVKLLSVEYAEDEKKNRPIVKASLKQVDADPAQMFCEKMEVQEVYAGKVTSTLLSKKNGETYFFVRCSNGADVLCGTSKSLNRFPYAGDYVEIRIMRIEKEVGRLFGMIISIRDSQENPYM